MDQEVGGAAATGDGDVMMRFLPTYQTVESMRRGMSPTEAAEDAIRRIMIRYSSFSGAIIAINKTGHFGRAGDVAHFCLTRYLLIELTSTHVDLAIVLTIQTSLCVYYNIPTYTCEYYALLITLGAIESRKLQNSR